LRFTVLVGRFIAGNSFSRECYHKWTKSRSPKLAHRELDGVSPCQFVPAKMLAGRATLCGAASKTSFHPRLDGVSPDQSGHAEIFAREAHDLPAVSVRALRANSFPDAKCRRVSMKLLEKLGPFDRKSGKLNVVIKSPKLPEQRNSFVSTNLKPTVLSKDCTRLPPN